MDIYALGIFNNIYNNFLNKLNRYQSSVINNCIIEIKNIKSTNVNNCKISIINKCISNSESTFKILNQCIAEELLLLNEKTRKQIEKSLNITAKEINNNIKKGYIQECYASAETDANININELLINNCNSLTNEPANLVFLNSGSASANCGIIKLNDALSNLETSSKINENIRLKYFLNLSYNDYIYILLIFFGIFFITFLILFFIKIKLHLSFKYINFFID